VITIIHKKCDKECSASHLVGKKEKRERDGRKEKGGWKGGRKKGRTEGREGERKKGRMEGREEGGRDGRKEGRKKTFLSILHLYRGRFKFTCPRLYVTQYKHQRCRLCHIPHNEHTPLHTLICT